MKNTNKLTAEQMNDVKLSNKAGAQDVLENNGRLALANDEIKRLVAKYSTKEHTFSHVIKAIIEGYTYGKTIAKLATKAMTINPQDTEFPSVKKLQEILTA